MALQDSRGGSPCIDENAVLDFVQGRLGEVEVARIDEHADGCLSCRQAIEEAVRAFRERSTGFDLPPDPLVTRFAAGDKLAGRYRIIRFIARGGMGEVYEAEDEMLGTHIAVKTVAAPISDNPLAARRLKQEVNLARRITHPNVCRIFDLGVHHGGAERPGPGVLFITMELIAGISLAQRLRDEGPFSPGAAVPIARAMAAAIGAAHRAGVIHRDFKCENVMLAPGGADGVRVVVMDFGLARGTSLSTHDSLEGRGLAGTLAYMAPEQLDGQKVGHAADIYALGVVMYEMLAGQLPFVPAPGEAGLAAVLTRLTDPAPPLRSVIPNIDARWNDVVAHCLEREIDRRLASADDVVRALADEVSVDVPAPAAAGRAAAPAARATPSVAPAVAPRSAWRRAGLVAVGLVSVGLGGLLAVIAATQHRPAPRDAASVAPGIVSSPAPVRVPPPAEPTPPPAPAEPPGGPTVATPKVATESTPDRPTGDRPATEAAVDRPPAARRPSAPGRARRDPTAAAAAPKRGSNAPAAPSGAAEKEAPKQPQKQQRSSDPEDGFIFQ